LLDALHERVAVQRLLLEEAKHHHFQRAWEEIACGVVEYRRH
jgi:hypothetical protein